MCGTHLWPRGKQSEFKSRRPDNLSEAKIVWASRQLLACVGDLKGFSLSSLRDGKAPDYVVVKSRRPDRLCRL